MPNLNPIQVDKPEIQTPFQIPAASKTDQLTLSVNIALDTAEWSYAFSSQIYLDGNDIYPAGAPAPSKLALASGVNLDGKALYLLVKVTLIYTARGFTGAPPVFTFSFCIDDGASNLGNFSASSTSNYVTNFNSLLLFQQL